MNALKLRVLSAVVMLPLFIGSIWLPNVWFSMVLSLFALVAAWEWGRLITFFFNLPRHLFAAFYAGLTVLLLWTVARWPVLPVVSVAFFWWIGAGALVMSYPKSALLLRRHAGIPAVVGMLVLIPAWRSLVELQGDQYGPHFMLFFMVLIWGADISAYFVGKRWGRNKLAPRLSPGKSWQGVYGALVTGCCISVIGGYFLGYHNALLWFSAVGLLTVLASIFGDLLESLMKREAGVKDSGDLIPGHGGVLDRIDSITAAAPVFLAFLLFLKV